MIGHKGTSNTAKLFLLSAVVLSMITFASNSHGVQQYQGLCARVKMEILQEMTLERIGFLATLKVTNNEGDAPITNFSASLTFENPALSTEDQIDDSSSLFFVQPPKLSGINAIDGTGMIAPGETAVVKWFIIPKIAAGGTEASGVVYKVGAKLAGYMYGNEISQDILKVIPDTIVVKPEPQLEITYFQPRDVYGDDPFTPDIVESPIPFTLGVLVKNAGYGVARKVVMKSTQPKIVEHKENLLLVARLLGARVNDEPTDYTSLTVNLGDIEPGKCAKGAWDMITSLSGEFIEFKASYTHASELGGEETSVIKSMNAYFILHEVLNDQPGRDNILDFLADLDNDPQWLPDAIYESDCNVLPVNVLTDVSANGTGLSATVHANADKEGWVYIRVDDPGQAKYGIESVVRSDGKVLNPHNYWTYVRYTKPDNQKLTYLNILDLVSLGQYEYYVTYAPSGTDTTPPVTTIRFSGEAQESDDIVYILPSTQVYFTVEDESPVGTYYRLDGQGDFLPAYPFTITESGLHTIEYYSRDEQGNEEDVRFQDVFVSGGLPEMASFGVDTDTMVQSGDALSTVANTIGISFRGVSTAPTLDAEIEVFRGNYSWVTLKGVPSSPTVGTGANITVAGTNVDYYRYKLGAGGSWSDERPVSEPIVLDGLSGDVDLYVMGRNAHGDYPSELDAVHCHWVVDEAGPITEISSDQPFPSNVRNISFHVSGGEMYRYTIDGGYYRPETTIDTPIVLSDLTDGEHTLSVIVRQDGVWQDESQATSFTFVVDHLYGTDLTGLELVRTHSVPDVNGTLIEWQWDGLDDNGVSQPAGWYTIRLTLTDGLGQDVRSVKIVQIQNVMGNLASLGAGAPQEGLEAGGDWLVWQDQSEGNWDIYALNTREAGATPIKVSTSLLNDERPDTDGQFVVWQARQGDGNWDVMVKALDGMGGALNITNTSEADETRPTISYPWVVFQRKSLLDPTSPWQLFAYNLVTGQEEAIDPTTQDELDPKISGPLVVWQDFRDVGYGEIYMKDLELGEVYRITDDPGGQYHPSISGNWIVWQDNRNGQNEIYGYNLLMGKEIRLTNTPEDEKYPFINGDWVVYTEDSLGEGIRNVRLLSLETMNMVQLTDTATMKTRVALSNGLLAWEDSSGIPHIETGRIPVLFPVFNNNCMVPVTEALSQAFPTAFSLVSYWHDLLGVNGVSRYLFTGAPQPQVETALYAGHAPTGDDFPILRDTFIWARFFGPRLLELGPDQCGAIDLSAGTNVVTYTCFPDGLTSYGVLRSLGLSNVNSIRMLDSRNGVWHSSVVKDGHITGEDFKIPRAAVIILDMAQPVMQWRP